MKTIRFSTIALAVCAVFGASTVHAQSVAPVPAPTIITTAPYTISKPGYYQLGADLTYFGNGATNDAIITINASNVTLDFAGHYISGPSNNAGTTLYGIYANERGNLNIINGTITFCYHGMYLFGNGSATTLNINQHIDNMLVSYCYYAGIFVPNTNNSSVSNCRVSFIGGSTYLSAAIGISMETSSTVKTSNQVVNTAVTNITSSSGQAYGIAGSNTLLVKGCTVANVTSTTSALTFGIYAARYAVDCTVTNCAEGVTYALKYRAIMTSSCTRPFDGGTAVGNENN